MPRGKVKWFNDAKGYRLIDEDVFVHFSATAMGVLKTLGERHDVEFKLQAGGKAPHAVNVQRVG